MRLRARRMLAGCGGLTLLALALFSDAAFLGRALFERDLTAWYYPQADDVVRILASGSWPLWHPYRSFGEPLLANPSSQILYPPAYLHLLFEPWTAYTWYVIGHLVFTGIGVQLLARHLGLSALASFLAAAAWTTSGPLLSCVNIWNHFSGATWLPWVLLAAARACDSLRARDAVLWGAALAAQAATGSPDASAMAALLSVAVVLARLARPPAGGAGRLLGTAVLAAAFALGLAAAQWLPSADLLQGSRRMALSESARARWSVAPAAFAQAVAPLFLKGLTLQVGDAVLADDNVRNPLLASLYLGAPVVILAAAGLAGPSRPLRRFLAVMLGLACGIALGSHAPVLGLLQRLLPPLAILRHPAKAMLLVPLATALLAGMGLDSLREAATAPRSRPLLAWGALVVGGCAVFAVLALLALQGRVSLPFRPEPLFTEALRRSAVHGAIAALAGGALLTLLLRRASGASATVPAAALAILELASANRPLNPTTPTPDLARRPATVAAIAGDGGGRATRVYGYDYLSRVRGKRHPEPAVLSALTAVPIHGVERALAMRALSPATGGAGLKGSYEPDVLGFSPPHLQALVVSLRAAEETPAYVRLLQLGGVRYVVALHEGSFPELEPVASLPGPLPLPFRVFRVPEPLPQVYAVGVGRVVGPDAGYQALSEPGFDFRSQVLLADGPELASPALVARIELHASPADRLRARVDFDAPGYLVVLQSFDPRWQASVDGQPAVLRRANVGFQALPVPAGRHDVELRYRPFAVVLGFGITALTLAAAAVVLASGGPARDAEQRHADREAHVP